ncbi:MAG: hypothetical protein ACJ71Q_03360 [Terriglobales bacterium]
MRRLSALLFVCSSLILAGTLHAQQFDAQFGISGIHSQSATNFDPNNVDHLPQSLSGGVYPSVAADFLLFHNLGVGGEISWRATRALYLDTLDYRPIFYDFNAVYARKVSRVGFAAMGGIGAQSTRFYEGGCVSINANGQCTDFVSSNHFLLHLGAALRLYVTHSVYVAPELHYYYVRNNVDFTSPNVTRYGLNIGYTFGK